MHRRARLVPTALEAESHRLRRQRGRAAYSGPDNILRGKLCTDHGT